MADRVLRVDFETRSTVELRDAGVHAYAAHATTDVWCMGYAFDDGPVDLWRMGDPCPPAGNGSTPALAIADAMAQFAAPTVSDDAECLFA